MKSKTTRSAFEKAVSAATSYSQENKLKTKLSHWCVKFLEKNESIIQKHQRAKNKLTKDLLRDLELKKIELADVAKEDSDTHKVGELLTNSRGLFVYSKENFQELTKFVNETNDKIDELTEAFVQEEIEFNTITFITENLENVDIFILRALKGFVVDFRHETENEPEKQLVETELNH